MPAPRLLLLEHLNLTVADKAVAIAFYVDGLGCQLNSVVGDAGITHVNLGLSQFHLPQSSSPATFQKWDGVIALQTTEPLAAVAARLRAHPVLLAHEAGVEAMMDEGEGDGGDEASSATVAATATATTAASLLRVRGPYGNVFHITSAPELRAHGCFAHLGHHFGLSKTLAAMPQVVHYCQPGTARGIAGFYKTVFDLDAQLSTDGTECAVEFETVADPAAGGATDDDGEAAASAAAVPRAHYRQVLVFRESADAQPRDNYDRTDAAKYHMAIYLPSDEAYEAAFERAFASGLLYYNKAFAHVAPEFSSSMNRADAMKYWQFRLKNIYAPTVNGAASSEAATAAGDAPATVADTQGAGGDAGAAAEPAAVAHGELLLMLEHEVRAPSHRANPTRRVLPKKDEGEVAKADTALPLTSSLAAEPGAE